MTYLLWLYSQVETEGVKSWHHISGDTTIFIETVEDNLSADQYERVAYGLNK